MGTITTVTGTQQTPDGRGVMIDMDDLKDLSDMVENNEFTDNYHSYIIRGLAPQGWRTIKSSDATIDDLDDYYNDFVKSVTKFRGLFQVQICILQKK